MPSKEGREDEATFQEFRPRPPAAEIKMNPLSLFCLLIAGHCLADFPLQTEAIALEKSRHSKSQLQKQVHWAYWLASHSIIHGALVGLITGNVYLGIAEAVLHAAIDFGKCEKLYGIHMDQGLHVLCKALWLVLMLS
jgi:hypothetical protein